ncbi:MAG: RNA methyltransferase [Bacteroidetes bacterium]|nr:MAG: RNA methyltransferase [Bacteroidota bacterium]
MPALSKSILSKIKSLSIKKYRDKFQLFVAEGPTLIADLQLSHLKIDSIYATKDWVENNPKAPAIELSSKELTRMSSLKTPNQVLCLVEIPKYEFDPKKLSALTLVLDNISDPGNMGSIIRTADWFGVQNIVCSMNCTDIYNSKVVQASMGSISRVKVHYTDLVPFVKGCKDAFAIYGLVVGGKSINKEQIAGDTLLIVGNESKGISQELSSVISKKIGIDSFGGAESLNAAVATAIVCYEFNRVN